MKLVYESARRKRYPIVLGKHFKTHFGRLRNSLFSDTNTKENMLKHCFENMYILIVSFA